MSAIGIRFLRSANSLFRPLCDIHSAEKQCPPAAGSECKADLCYAIVSFMKCMDLSTHPDLSTNYQSPTVLSWAFLLPVALGSWGFVRVPADFPECHFACVQRLFHSLRGYILPNLTHLKKPEVRKGPKFELCISTSYARTFQVVLFGIG